MQEREDFRQICLMVTHRNRQIMCAAVVDNRGKLLFGHSATKHCPEDMKTARTRKSTNDTFYYCGGNNVAYRFFNNCIVPIINLNNNNNSKNTADISQKELIPVYDMISPVNKFVKIGITPLNESRDKFLCVYFDPSSFNNINASKSISHALSGLIP
jgi:hypothetical protein